MNKLQAHFARMQEMASRYLEPGPYVDRDGVKWKSRAAQHVGFINDMLYSLDGPEQREAQNEG